MTHVRNVNALKYVDMPSNSQPLGIHVNEIEKSFVCLKYKSILESVSHCNLMYFGHRSCRRFYLNAQAQAHV